MPRSRFERKPKNCGLYTLIPSEDGKYWEYFRFTPKGAAAGRRGGKKSLTKLARKTHYDIDEGITLPITNLHVAQDCVDRAIQAGLFEDAICGNTPDDKNPILRDFVLEMMDPHAKLFEWLQGDPKTKIGIKRFKSYASSFRVHGYDSLPDNLTLRQADKDDISDFMRNVRIHIDNVRIEKAKKNPNSKQRTSNDAENNCLQAVRKSYLYAMEGLKIVNSDPTEDIRVIAKKRIERDILLPEELRALLDELRLYSRTEPNRPYSYKMYVLCSLLTHSGMREGEARALRIEKISRVYVRRKKKEKPTRFFKIRVDTNWDDETKALKSTKSDEAHNVYIWEDLAKELIDLYHTHENPLGLIFSSNSDFTRPVDKSVIYDYVYRAMRAIGISDAERRERNIDMHSIRAFYITQAEALAMNQRHREIMKETAHRTEAAHSRYIQHSFLSAYQLARLSRDLLKEEDLEEVYKDALVEEGRTLFEEEPIMSDNSDDGDDET